MAIIVGTPLAVDRLSPSNDSFGRLRVSDPHTLFTVQNQYDVNNIKMENFISGTGVAASHSANTRMVTLSATTGANPIYWELCTGVTFSAGPTYGNVNTTYSGMEQSTAVGTFSTIGGWVIQSGYVAATNLAVGSLSHSVSIEYPLTLDRAGVARANGTYTLLVTGIGGTSATRASFSWEEIR